MPQLRHIFGQVKLRVNFAEVIREGRIVIVNLAKGSLGEDAARITGSLFVSSLCAAAMERGTSNTDGRRDFTLILDEAQSFLLDALVTVLSESRKFGLGMALCHQYLAQLPSGVQTAVLGNVGTTFAFRVSGEDADVLAKHYGTLFAPSQFIELHPFTTLVRPLDCAGFPFRLAIRELAPAFQHDANYIRHRSRQRFCTLRSEVERKLSKWFGASDVESSARSSPVPSRTVLQDIAASRDHLPTRPGPSDRRATFAVLSAHGFKSREDHILREGSASLPDVRKLSNNTACRRNRRKSQGKTFLDV